MRRSVVVIDYGMGNLFSVARALEWCGAEISFADSAAAIDSAEYLVLPGVGAFPDGMAGLDQRGLIEPIKNYVHRGRPMLGICLGMQLLMDYSEEYGHHDGLALIPGKVVPIPGVDLEGCRQKIPHIGWNKLFPSNGCLWDKTILETLKRGASVYFVHSYTVVPSSPKVRLADTFYGGHNISAVISSRNIIGCQFHPEKSGEIGLQIIKNFFRLSG